jgi:hypothetical protein
MTQQNAALVEESTAAATAMREQALRLEQVVAVFKVGQESLVARTAPMAAPRQMPVASAPVAAPRSTPVTASKPAALAPAKATAAAARPSPAPAATAQAPALRRPAPAGTTVASADDDEWETF